MLVDYFLSEQAAEARGSIAERARAAQRVAEMLKLVGDPFQFDLLARKAADLLAIGEEVLRKEARGAGRAATPSRFARDTRANAAPAAASAAGGGDAGAKAEIGLIALALLHPELRNEIAQAGAEANFEEIRLGGVLADLCRTDEPYTALEHWIADRLTADEQGRVSEFAVGPLTDDIADDIQKDRSELGPKPRAGQRLCRCARAAAARTRAGPAARERRRPSRRAGRDRASAGSMTVTRIHHASSIHARVQMNECSGEQPLSLLRELATIRVA